MDLVLATPPVPCNFADIMNGRGAVWWGAGRLNSKSILLWIADVIANDPP